MTSEHDDLCDFPCLVDVIGKNWHATWWDKFDRATRGGNDMFCAPYSLMRLYGQVVHDDIWWWIAPLSYKARQYMYIGAQYSLMGLYSQTVHDDIWWWIAPWAIRPGGTCINAQCCGLFNQSIRGGNIIWYDRASRGGILGSPRFNMWWKWVLVRKIRIW